MSSMYMRLFIAFLAVSSVACSGCNAAPSPKGFAGRVGNFAGSKGGVKETPPGTSPIGEVADGGYGIPSGPLTPVAPVSGVDDRRILELQSQQARNVEVKVSAPVFRLLPDDRKGSPHQRFLLRLSNASTVLVAHNIDLAPYVPLQVGDLVTIKGEYIWNRKGGVLHYTHHTTNRRHEGGYIELRGQKFQ